MCHGMSRKANENKDLGVRDNRPINLHKINELRYLVLEHVINNQRPQFQNMAAKGELEEARPWWFGIRVTRG